jgi:hypothetical protein
MTQEEVVKLLKHEIRQLGNQNRWSINNNVDQTAVSRVLAGHLPPPPRVLKVLGLRKVISYVDSV